MEAVAEATSLDCISLFPHDRDRDRNEAGEFGPEWGEVVEIEEENWYFRMAKHQDWLIAHIEANPSFVSPTIRRNEILECFPTSNKPGRGIGVDHDFRRPGPRIVVGGH